MDIKNINWDNSCSYYFCSEDTHKPPGDLQLAEKFPAHLWLTTSGSYSLERSWIGISKTAFLASANSVNKHLQVIPADRWLNVLPPIHVGGLAIFARAALAGVSVKDLSASRWSPLHFLENLTAEGATLTSLVPTQVFDLVSAMLESPKSLRVVLVGGGALSPELYLSARSLGWPLLPSFGMTECSSQLATAGLKSLKCKTEFPELLLLDHVEARISPDCFLEVQSPALFTAKVQLHEGHWQIERREGWYKTSDRALIEGDKLLPLGRAQDFIKIAGELVNLKNLREIFLLKMDQQLHHELWALTSVFDSRLGQKIILVLEENLSPSQRVNMQMHVDKFNAEVMGLVRVSQVKFIDKLPITELGKVSYARLEQKLKAVDFLG